MINLFFDLILAIIPSFLFYLFFAISTKRLQIKLKKYSLYSIILLFSGFALAYALSFLKLFVYHKIPVQAEFNIRFNILFAVLSEEIGKFLFLILFFKFFTNINLKMNKVTKVIPLGILFGIGFGFYETILIALTDRTLILQRAVSSNIIHLITSVFLTYYINRATQCRECRGVIRGLFFALLIHFVFNEITRFETKVFLAFLFAIIILSFVKFNLLIAQDLHTKDKDLIVINDQESL